MRRAPIRRATVAISTKANTSAAARAKFGTRRIWNAGPSTAKPMLAPAKTAAFRTMLVRHRPVGALATGWLADTEAPCRSNSASAASSASSEIPISCASDRRRAMGMRSAASASSAMARRRMWFTASSGTLLSSSRKIKSTPGVCAADRHLPTANGQLSRTPSRLLESRHA